MRDKEMLVETKVLQMAEKLEMEIRKKVPEKYNETLQKINKKIKTLEK